MINISRYANQILSSGSPHTVLSYRKENSYNYKSKTPNRSQLRKRVWWCDKLTLVDFVFMVFMNRYRLAGCSALILKVVVVLEGKNTRNLVMG